MALRRSGTPLWNSPGSELVSGRVGLISRIGEGDGAGDRVALERALAFVSAAFFIFGQKVEGVAGKRSLQLVSAKSAGELFSFLLQFQGKVERCTVKVGG